MYPCFGISVYCDLTAPLFSKLLIGTMHTIVEILSIRGKNGGRVEREGGGTGWREREKGREGENVYLICGYACACTCTCMYAHMN